MSWVSSRGLRSSTSPICNFNKKLWDCESSGWNVTEIVCSSATASVPSIGSTSNCSGNPLAGSFSLHFTGTAHTLASFSDSVAFCFNRRRSKSTSLVSKFTFGTAPMAQMANSTGTGLFSTVATSVSEKLPSTAGKQQSLTSRVSSMSSSISCGSMLNTDSLALSAMSLFFGSFAAAPFALAFGSTGVARAGSPTAEPSGPLKLKRTLALNRELLVTRSVSIWRSTLFSSFARGFPSTCSGSW
mmetsp:Transcript_39339/g.110520  ORF Transcript_39339/g.110520 Transcript_39339/m.110520 type:complete len:243 (-) Transcript_39339:1817-2545(-)